MVVNALGPPTNTSNFRSDLSLCMPEGFKCPISISPEPRGDFSTPHSRKPKINRQQQMMGTGERSARQSSYGDLGSYYGQKHVERPPFDRGSLRVNGSAKRGVRGGPRSTAGGPAPPPSLALITCTTGDPLLFSETNLDWSKLNIFRTRLCDRLTQTRSCHMANRCLFSHEINWPRRTPFLPRASALTLRYIPVWCPRLSWPPVQGFCDSSGKIEWRTSCVEEEWSGSRGQEKCGRADNCPFVHSIEEFLYHPEIYKTRSCCLANDDNFEEELHSSSCVALCPWYFCPFAHDAYEIRDLRACRYAWHPPPQIVDNHYVARTQGFDALELSIIDFVRRNGCADLYTSTSSPLWPARLPPVLFPAENSSLEDLEFSEQHRVSDPLLYYMAVASLLNLLLYPVENFYVPTLLSLQCALLHYQTGLAGPLTAKDIIDAYHYHLAPPADSDNKYFNAPDFGAPDFAAPDSALISNSSLVTASSTHAPNSPLASTSPMHSHGQRLTNPRLPNAHVPHLVNSRHPNPSGSMGGSMGGSTVGSASPMANSPMGSSPMGCGLGMTNQMSNSPMAASPMANSPMGSSSMCGSGIGASASLSMGSGNGNSGMARSAHNHRNNGGAAGQGAASGGNACRSGGDGARTNESMDMQSILDLLQNDEIWRMMESLDNSPSAASAKQHINASQRSSSASSSGCANAQFSATFASASFSQATPTGHAGSFSHGGAAAGVQGVSCAINGQNPLPSSSTTLSAPVSASGDTGAPVKASSQKGGSEASGNSTQASTPLASSGLTNPQNYNEFTSLSYSSMADSACSPAGHAGAASGSDSTASRNAPRGPKDAAAYADEPPAPAAPADQQ